MQSSTPKIGSLIVVHGSRPCVGTSTMAALTAATLAHQGSKVLLLTTDPDAPFDSASILSSDVTDCHLNELVALTNANRLTSKTLNDYVTFLTEDLAYLRPSSPLEGMSSKPGNLLLAILSVACENFHYVVVDVDYIKTPYATKLTGAADLVIHVLGQDEKSICYAKAAYKEKALGEDGLLLPVVANCYDGLPTQPKAIEQHLKIGEVFSVPANNDVFEAVRLRSIYDLVVHQKKRTGLFGGRRRNTENLALSQIANLCVLMKDALNVEKGVKPDGSNR